MANTGIRSLENVNLLPQIHYLTEVSKHILFLTYKTIFFFSTVEFAELCLDVQPPFVPQTTPGSLLKTPSSSMPPEVIHSTSIVFPDGGTTQSISDVSTTPAPRGKTNSFPGSLLFPSPRVKGTLHGTGKRENLVTWLVVRVWDSREWGIRHLAENEHALGKCPLDTGKWETCNKSLRGLHHQERKKCIIQSNDFQLQTPLTWEQ